MKFRQKFCAHLLVVLTALFSTTLAQATLGGDTASVKADEQALAASDAGTVSFNHYSVQTFLVGTLLVKEYISLDGTVFAIAWEGRRHPSFKILLGTYFSDFQKSRVKSKKLHTRGAHSLKGTKITVETWGNMRKLQGHAYLPSLLPQDVSADEIQ